MKKILAVAIGLLFLSAFGQSRADDASVQKEKAESKVDADQKNLNASNKAMGDDKAAIHENNEKISGEKKDRKRHSKKLAQHRAELKDAKDEGDVKEANEKRGDIKNDKKDLRQDNASLKKHRARRAKKIDAMKDERGENHQMGKDLNKSEDKLQSANEKVEDKKQDSAAK
jgi:chromosome segregation ATPase